MSNYEKILIFVPTYLDSERYCFWVRVNDQFNHKPQRTISVRSRYCVGLYLFGALAFGRATLTDKKVHAFLCMYGKQ